MTASKEMIDAGAAILMEIGIEAGQARYLASRVWASMELVKPDRRSEQLAVRLTPEDKADVAAAAAKLNVGNAEFIRLSLAYMTKHVELLMEKVDG